MSRCSTIWVESAVEGEGTGPHRGALRGGSHVHVFSPDGSAVSFTYEDEVLARLGPGSGEHQLNRRRGHAPELAPGWPSEGRVFTLRSGREEFRTVNKLDPFTTSWDSLERHRKLQVRQTHRRNAHLPSEREPPVTI